MKVLMISGDKNLLDPNTEAGERLALQRSAIEGLDVFVWPQVHSKWQIYQAARKNRYDIITTQDPFWRGLLGLKIAWLTGTKLNVQVHTDLSVYGGLRHILMQMVLRHADSVRVVSEKIKRQVETIAPNVKISVLPIFVTVEKFIGLEHSPQSKKVLLWIGRFENEKDPSRALKVLREVQETGVECKLIMLGSGSLEAVLKKSAAGLPVEFPGWQSPAPYVQMADVVVSTSKHESYGASIIEALAAGVPVVASDVGIAKEAGAIVVPREKLAEAVTEVLRSGVRGELKLPVLSAEEWAQAWRKSLV